MDSNEYQKLAARTECDQGKAYQRIASGEQVFTRLNHAILGMTGEVGELAAAIERWIHYGKPLDTVNVKEELGDLLWYIALACNAMGFDLSRVMSLNIEKLQRRYPERYTDEAADEENRDRQAERAVLEQEGPKTSDYQRTIDRECRETYGSIEEYRAAMKSMGRHVSAKYNRLCKLCSRHPIHKDNTAGICPDCIESLREILH